ncbi:ATP-dependent DNA helicase RecG [Lutibaculum baratangense]|uniref:ATP-dependent DNA helicase RecG n=1 Tax=Lutibaculum baratangense AMV1 TaxID=631454 RepID=V4RU06_9HYPH|nr:ATP-dependent DNA helicase RecG [Lutibaculum baratangense]ESR26580.1 ATP-dependent DNA helicase RecG [Lutibaculum baratangense AMV1]
MRPPALNPLFAPITSLPGVGPKIAALFRRLLPEGDGDMPAVVDLLFHLPTGLIDRRHRPKVRDALAGDLATMLVTVEEHRAPPPGRSRAPYRVVVSDESGSMTIVFFNAQPRWVAGVLPLGKSVWVSGKVEMYDGMLQIVHPDHIVAEDEAERLPEVEPVYPLTAGLTLRGVSKSVRAAVDRVPALPEWQRSDVLRQHHWRSFSAALTALHLPQRAEDLEPESPALARLAYDEILAGQVALSLTRSRLRKVAGMARKGDGRIVRSILAGLPFELTAAQQAALTEVEADLAAPERMLRLLQGDVGSGKTVIGLLAMARVIETGAQCALMAPTEILARQHHATLGKLAAGSGLRIGLLTGREKGRARDQILVAAAEGYLDILVGTHALFEQHVGFRDLGLAVIDEQHRFGVHQRLSLAAKGRAVDMLVMTATPIPRTLLLTHYGDMDVTRIAEKPPGRQAIETRLVSQERLPEVIAALGRTISQGNRVYWVCPLVEDSETVDVVSVGERFASLDKAFPGQVGLVHGQLSGADKDAAMQAFVEGRTAILVATTVIEVGVDVPEASVIVIENAERFGLAQLHQLRGRVGRGTSASACLLLYGAQLSENARSRLQTMRETDDGFRIAEEDLKLRGGGEVLGTRQSGTPEFRVARLESHLDLVEEARQDARLLLDQDPSLETARGQAVRILLQLFRRDSAMALLGAG